LRLILIYVGGEELWDVFQLSTRETRPARMGTEDVTRGEHPSTDVSENVSKRKLVGVRARREWLAEQLRTSPAMRAEDVAAYWKISVRTAFRDLERYRSSQN